MYIIIITIGTCPFHQLEREVTDRSPTTAVGQGVLVGRVKRGVPNHTFGEESINPHLLCLTTLDAE